MSLCNGDADVSNTELFTTLLTKNDLEMGRLSQVHEVLGIPAPELVLLSVIENATSTIRVIVPLSTELLLNGVRQLHKLDRL